jgi:hypothetical protein
MKNEKRLSLKDTMGITKLRIDLVKQLEDANTKIAELEKELEHCREMYRRDA